MIEIDYYIRKQALTGIEEECGDFGFVKEYDDCCLIALVDVLGHGKEAYDVALMAETYLIENYSKEPAELIKGLHEHLKDTRGAVSTVCKLAIETGELKYSAMGNIAGRVMGNNPFRLTGKDGILGYMIPTPVEHQIKLYTGDILILSSDGVKEHFDPIDYPEILLGNAKRITADFIDQLGKKNDDASCIVLRYGV